MNLKEAFDLGVKTCKQIKCFDKNGINYWSINPLDPKTNTIEKNIKEILKDSYFEFYLFSDKWEVVDNKVVQASSWAQVKNLTTNTLYYNVFFKKVLPDNIRIYVEIL
jgi:hypothetical protein